MLFFEDDKGRKWYLHEKVTSRGGMIRYFSQNEADSVPIPAGHEVIVSKTGLPFLRRQS